MAASVIPFNRSMSMDNRDEIIRTQMDLISTLVSNNLKNLADDIWGSPAPKPAAPKNCWTAKKLWANWYFIPISSP